MNQLDRYIGRTVAFTMFLSALGLVGLFALFTFLDQLEDIENDYTFFTVLQYVGYSIPRIFYETLPYAALIGCLAGLGLLANNSELIVIRAAGISTWRIAWAAMKPALALVVFGLFVGELVLPDFERTARVIRENAMEDDITPQGGFWYREGDTFMHFGRVSHVGELRNVKQYIIDSDHRLEKTLWASKARFIPDEVSGHWVMEDVVMTDLTQKREQRLGSMIWNTGLTPALIKTEILVEPDKMSILELNRKIEYMRTQGLNSGKFELGFWTKTFQPLASLTLVFVAISFIFGPLRETTMGMRIVSGLVVGILFKFIQDLLSPASLVFGFSPLLATLIPMTICLIAGVYLLRRAN